MNKGYWIKLTKDCFDFQKWFVFSCGVNEFAEFHSISYVMFWLLSLCVVQSDKGHILLDKSIFITKLYLKDLKLYGYVLVPIFKELKSSNMIIIENEKEFNAFLLESCKVTNDAE